MEITRKIQKIVPSLLALFLVGGLAAEVLAQKAYPTKPVTLTVGYAPGGATDVSARALGVAMEKIWGQPGIVVNKPGAATAVQMDFVKKSPPDGYTLGIFTSGGLTATHLREVPYHFFDDFTHFAQYGSFIFAVAVSSDSPWKTLKDLVDHAHKNPGKLRYGAVPAGTIGHLMAEQFAFLNKIKWVHVPFAGDSEAGAALLGNHLEVIVTTYSGWGPYVGAGKVRVLGVIHDNRLKEFPDVPTIKEAGFQDTGGFGLLGVFGPKNFPAQEKSKILSTLRAAVKDPEFIKVMDKQCAPAVYREGEEWISYLKEFDSDTVKLMKMLGLKVVRESYK